MAALSFTPAPHEQAYFNGLFQAADVQRTNNIGGAQAVSFFARSKLPMDVLKNIWTVADQPSTSSLDRTKFAVAVRLIQLTQNGQKGQGPNLAAPPGVTLRPAFFEGVSGVSVALPPTGGQPPQQQFQQPPQAQQQLSPQQQQLQAPPTPGRASMRQQLQQPPPTPSRPTVGQPPMPPSNSPTKSRALTQDPYALTPPERGRYESLFPQYAKDGYVYGKEAVELFSKSGVNQAVLRDIWNMVDYPVDNRLDKLEFALAMHLIVCISKKNMPVPPNGLPLSLKMLKQQEHQQQPTPVTSPLSQDEDTPQQPNPATAPQQQTPHPPQPQQQQQQIERGYHGGHEAESRSRMNSYQNIGPPAASMGGINVPPSPSQNRQFDTPPPVTQAGGMNISDAFEGLSTESADVSSLPSYVPEPLQPMSQPEPPATIPAATQSLPAAVRQTQPVSIADVPDPPKSTQALASSYDMGDPNEELTKLRSVLQKLQAENISLKARLGSMSEEERDVQKELSATVAEIGKLSNGLTALRAEVLEAKSKLMESTAELKAAREKKGVIMDMISEVQETKDAIGEATKSIERAMDAAQDAAPAAPPQQNDMFESNLFGYDAAPSQVPASNDQGSGHVEGQGIQNAALRADAALSATAPPVPSSSHIQDHNPPPVSQHPGGQFHSPVAPGIPAVTTVESSDLDSGGGSADRVESYGVTPAEPPIQMFGGHNRRDSNPFSADFVMGGAAPPLPAQQDAPALQQPVVPLSNAESYGQEDGGAAEVQNVEELKTVEELKKKVALAEETARDAAAAHRKLMAETDELRRDADKAEAHARTLKAQADEKKKGAFGGGKKKKLLKEAERAAADSADIRKRFMAVQARANDAQSVVMETKREVEKLRNEAEQAELDAVQMASLREREQARQKAEQEAQRNTQQSAAPQQPHSANGLTSDHGKNSLPAASNGASYGGYGAPPVMPAPIAPPGGYAQPMGQPAGYGQFGSPGMGGMGSGMGGFGAGVMSGGDDRFDLPSPDQLPNVQHSDPYSNPF